MDGGAEIATVLHRFSVQDYHRMAETGVFDRARVELIRGAIIDMAPIGTPHMWTVTRLTRLLARLMVEERANVAVQGSIRLDLSSEPEPDILLLAWDADETVHPGPEDALLIIEVADSSLAFDRAVKAPLYAGAGVREYWIVNLPERVVEVHRDPGPDGYRHVTTAGSGQLAPVALPDFAVAVADMLPQVRA